MPQRVRPGSLGDASTARDATHDPSGGVAIESLTVDSNEDGSFAALTDREVDGAGSSGRQWDGDDLPTFAVDGQSAVAPFEAQRFDVGAGGFRDAQAVQREQADQRMVAGARESSGDEHGPDFVAAQAGGAGLVVEPRPAHVDRRGDRDESFFFGVA